MFFSIDNKSVCKGLFHAMHRGCHFRPYPDKKIVFLMLIHLPERLACLGRDINETSEPELNFWH